MVIAVLAAFVAGCGRAPQYDARLVAADSLLRNEPASALAIVDTLCRDSLATEGDRAYLDLLLTQARYRCYVAATSDSDINRALAYYQTRLSGWRADPGDREKLTRAHLYKGAVMEELGHPDSAMLHYKQAEAVADTADHFNLGYARMRMGALYRDNCSTDGKDILYYEKALENFKKADDTTFQLKCMIRLGSLYCLNSPQKADSLLNAAIPIADKTGDTAEYVIAAQNLIKNDLHLERHEKACQLARQVLSMNFRISNATFYIYSAGAYVNLGMPDSAETLLNIAEGRGIKNEIDRLAFLDVKREIALARGDVISSERYERAVTSLEDSLFSIGSSMNITMAKDAVQENMLQTISKRQRSLAMRISLFGIVLLTLLPLSAYFLYRKRHYKKLAVELSESYGYQCGELAVLQQNLENLNIRDGKLRDFINSYLKLMRGLLEECYHQPKVSYTQKIKAIVRFGKDNKEAWIGLYEYIDMEYNGIISRTRADYPDLNDKDLLVIAMTATGFSYIQMAMILGYSDASSISSVKIRLAKKMKIDRTLNDYISGFKTRS